MKFIIACLFLSVALVSESKHTILGSGTQLVHHKELKYSAQVFRRRVETYTYIHPTGSYVFGRSILGIRAYDMKGPNSEASANVTEGGLGTNIMTLRMKSGRGEELHYDLYIYA